MGMHIKKTRIACRIRTIFMMLLITSCTFSVANPPSDAFTYEAFGCFGFCARYKATLFADGTFIFDGEEYVRSPGVFKENRDPMLFEQLIALTKDYDIYEFETDYNGASEKGICESIITDQPRTRMTFQYQGRIKVIDHYEGCLGFDREEQLYELESAVFDLFKLDEFMMTDAQRKNLFRG